MSQTLSGTALDHDVRALRAVERARSVDGADAPHARADVQMDSAGRLSCSSGQAGLRQSTWRRPTTRTSSRRICQASKPEDIDVQIVGNELSIAGEVKESQRDGNREAAVPPHGPLLLSRRPREPPRPRDRSRRSYRAASSKVIVPKSERAERGVASRSRRRVRCERVGPPTPLAAAVHARGRSSRGHPEGLLVQRALT